MSELAINYPFDEMFWIKVNRLQNNKVMVTAYNGNLPVTSAIAPDHHEMVDRYGMINLPFVYHNGVKHVAGEHELFYVHPEMLPSIAEEVGMGELELS